MDLCMHCWPGEHKSCLKFELLGSCFGDLSLRQYRRAYATEQLGISANTLDNFEHVWEQTTL